MFSKCNILNIIAIVCLAIALISLTYHFNDVAIWATVAFRL